MGMISALGNLRSMWRKSRRSRIIVSAALIGVFSGISGLGLPVEDALTNLRTNLRYDVADDSIVVVEIDDKTLDVYQAEDAPRSQDAVLIENLVAAGAKLVAFDRSYDFLEDPKQDRILADKLKEHPGKVFMGAIYAQRGRDKRNTFLPAPIFREHVGVVSLVGFIHPFRLSASFPFKTDTEMGTVPSMSAKLAGLEELPDGMFRPDFAIDTDTVPRYSYIDVVDGKVPAEKLRGRSIIVATTAFAFHDFHPMPSQGYVPGAYFHVVAAHTLKNGMPIDLGWLAAFLPVLALIVSGIGQGRPVDRFAGIVAIVGFRPVPARWLFHQDGRVSGGNHGWHRHLPRPHARPGRGGRAGQSGIGPAQSPGAPGL
jgi:diguanylate cyclase